MKNKINEFNNLYKPALERAEEIRKNLGRHCIDHALVFFNNHHTRSDGIPELIHYPIPTIICELSGIQTKIGFDIATDKTTYFMYPLTARNYMTKLHFATEELYDYYVRNKNHE